MSVAVTLEGDGFLVYSGIYAYNAVLCAIDIGSVFYHVGWPCGILALFCAFFGTLLAAALFPLVKPYGLPSLITAFILTTWLFVLPKKSFGQMHPTTTNRQQPVSLAEAEANLSNAERNEPG
jgi:urea transporter